MSVSYRMVQWNRHKRVYDALTALAVGAYIAAFVGVGLVVNRADGGVSAPILAMRALGTCALVLLHVALCIGPLARISPLVAPLLYNRRHLGVTTFALAALHAVLAIGFYGAFGVRFPIAAVVDPPRAGPAFEAMGFGALATLFVMAATSHDFWLQNLTPRVWKGIHLCVVGGYALAVLHVAFGALQSEPSRALSAPLLAGAAIVCGLHLFTGWREVLRDFRGARAADGWIDAGPADALAEGRARAVAVRGGERIALVRHGGQVCAMSNVCAHQGGPLGEGRVIDGCLTCPWHGYQYGPCSGASPPPFTERAPTHRVRIENGRVQVRAQEDSP